eukprot:s849_g3.t1
MPLMPKPFVSSDRSPMKSDEGSTADDSDPQDLLASSQDEMAPAPWKLPSTGLVPQAESFDFSQVNPVKPVPAYIMNAEGVQDGQMATQWLQNEMQELIEMMCHREAEMHQLEWQLTALHGSHAASVLPIQNPMQRAGLDAQILNLQAQLSHIMNSLRIKQLATHPAEPKKVLQKKHSMDPPEEKFDEDDVFTVMMRNIPNKYTQRMLIDEINEAGFDGAYDFLYLPIDKESNANKGYAFLNFLRPDLAYAFKLAYDGKQMAQFKSTKIVSVAPATIQGFDANYEHFSRTRVNYGDVDSRPLFLKTKKGKSKTSIPGFLKKTRTAQDNMSGSLPGAMSPSMSPIGMASPVTDIMNEAGFCPFCGTRRQAHFLFCQGCGTKF